MLLRGRVLLAQVSSAKVAGWRVTVETPLYQALENGGATRFFCKQRELAFDQASAFVAYASGIEPKAKKKEDVVFEQAAGQLAAATSTNTAANSSSSSSSSSNTSTGTASTTTATSQNHENSSSSSKMSSGKGGGGNSSDRGSAAAGSGKGDSSSSSSSGGSAADVPASQDDDGKKSRAGNSGSEKSNPAGSGSSGSTTNNSNTKSSNNNNNSSSNNSNANSKTSKNNSTANNNSNSNSNTASQSSGKGGNPNSTNNNTNSTTNNASSSNSSSSSSSSSTPTTSAVGQREKSAQPGAGPAASSRLLIKSPLPAPAQRAKDTAALFFNALSHHAKPAAAAAAAPKPSPPTQGPAAAAVADATASVLTAISVESLALELFKRPGEGAEEEVRLRTAAGTHTGVPAVRAFLQKESGFSEAEQRLVNFIKTYLPVVPRKEYPLVAAFVIIERKLLAPSGAPVRLNVQRSVIPDVPSPRPYRNGSADERRSLFLIRSQDREALSMPSFPPYPSPDGGSLAVEQCSVKGTAGKPIVVTASGELTLLDFVAQTNHPRYNDVPFVVTARKMVAVQWSGLH
ncbi:hypothetical protein DIPPA_20371 [Diplonema papillatum]|nr:hypothetical protein DIPPA_20371 [Diplonema papillatum]